MQAERSLPRRVRRWGVTALLHLLQPLARLRGRLEGGLTPWRRRTLPRGGLRLWRRFGLWSERWRDPVARLTALESQLRGAGVSVRRGGPLDDFDLDLRCGTLCSLRLLMAVEEHFE